MSSLSESLAGRAGVFELMLMAINEIRGQLFTKSLDTFLYDGLFPAICAKKNISKLLWRPSSTG